MIPVAIVGGGPVGLVSSILLSMSGIDHVVFEQYPDTSIHPKALGINQRTVEIFQHLGIEEELIKHRAPFDSVSHTAWYTGFGKGDVEIVKREAWGAGERAQEYERNSPAQYSILPQIRLEPILKRRALSLNPKALRYNMKVLNVMEEKDSVILLVRTKAGFEEEVRARYVLGSDGGRGFAQNIGIDWEGKQDIVEMMTVHFKAELEALHPDKNVFLSWLINPTMRGSLGTGYCYHIGPYYPKREAKSEWVFAFPRLPEDPKIFDREDTIKRIQRSLGIPGLDIDLFSISSWTVNAVVTNEYRSKDGKIFLVGDAAHRFPPWGALGMNTGIQDAYNLIWKLVLALRSPDPKRFDSLLDTYEVERKPIARRVASNSLSNMLNHGNVMDTAVGISPDASIEDNLEAVRAFSDPSHPQHKAKRDAVKKASEDLDLEFNAPGIEIGWFYPSADINQEGDKTRHDGQVLENGEYDITNYHPSTIPGHNLPHAWLKKGDKEVSTRHLIRLDSFVLLANSSQWVPLQNRLVDVEVIDGKGGWADRDGTWRSLCNVGSTGAVLVRPDGIVAWRAREWTQEVTESVSSVLDVVLKLRHED
ncbi:FAD binding domain-containing protein [Annulohypoxylon truncatum]|uniref:FAD binding domain-containing protein n=1 Tax=Annulohypoxylon truncatum TaxID=327061 RepID=UPI002007C636|nr:FAD binding domain-containing protein [Annulohypoxylon truncatum]KAI1213393.1 FAD binding domain-containing protein [Annulohypoxylon truncatum]